MLLSLIDLEKFRVPGKASQGFGVTGRTPDAWFHYMLVPSSARSEKLSYLILKTIGLFE